ncbi:MAG: RrF2 family transcriptional regulator [Planctomycetota bacterium]|jgi:Rrf2 family protein
MRISRSTGYALLAVGYLAQHQKQKIVLSQDISKKYNIPLEYLLKILQQLVKANLLRSKRGPRGGFSLGKPIKKMTLLQVIEAVDGPMVSQLDLAEHARGERYAARVEQTYCKALAQARGVFDKVKIADLL